MCEHFDNSMSAQINPARSRHSWRQHVSIIDGAEVNLVSCELGEQSRLYNEMAARARNLRTTSWSRSWTRASLVHLTFPSPYHVQQCSQGSRH
jgi:hypothetical protein